MSTEQSLKKMEQMQQRYNHAVENIEELRDLEQRLDQIHFNLKQLKKYYISDWAHDKKEIEQNTSIFLPIMEKDSVYKLIAEHYKESKKIIKKLVDEL